MEKECVQTIEEAGSDELGHEDNMDLKLVWPCGDESRRKRG